MADFNGDGIPDIAIGTNGTTTGYLSILLGNGNGTFQAAKIFPGLPNNQAMVVAPFVNSGPLDILTVSNNASGLNNGALFIGDGKGGGTLGFPFSLGLDSVNGIAAGDFNRDGSQDFVVTGIIFGSWCFATTNGKGNGTFSGPTLNAIGSNPLAVAVGAFNTNGYPDIVVADSVADQVTIFQNNSQGYFLPAGQANTGTHPIAMATGDFNGDGFLDLAVVNYGSNNITIFFGHGNETLTADTTLPTGHSPTSIAVGDFNGDGIADLAVVNSADKTVTILLGKGNGTFTATTPLATGINPVNVVAGDFSGTGFSSLAVTNQDIAATTGSTLTIQAAQLTETATATATKINPVGTGAHLVDAVYGGDSLYNTSVSATTSINGTLTAAATPVLTPAPGTYTTAQKVTITDTTIGATIYYTTNGATPTAASTKYTGSIPVSASETIKAIAVKTGYNNSNVASAGYAIEAALPIFTPAAGTYAAAQHITIADATKGAAIYYTTNGSTPTTASTKYSTPILVSASEVIHSIAVAPGYANSAVASAKYTIETPAATPVFSVATGTYATKQSVTITDSTSAAVIYYTTNGATPTTASTKYTGAISVAASETLKAIAVATGYTNSAVATAAYTIGYPIQTFVATSSGTNTVTIPVGGSAAFTVASQNQGGQSYPSVTVKTSSGANPSLPVKITLCQTNPATSQCLAAPAPTVTVAPFAAGATPSFSVFVTATAAIASSPNNEVVVLFTNSSGTVLGSASVLVVTN